MADKRREMCGFGGYYDAEDRCDKCQRSVGAGCAYGLIPDSILHVAPPGWNESFMAYRAARLKRGEG